MTVLDYFINNQPRYSRRLMSRTRGNKQITEDVMQDSVINLMVSKIGEVENNHLYVSTTIFNMLNNYYRKNNRYVPMSDEVARKLENHSYEHIPCLSVDEEREILVKEKIEQLHPRQKQVIKSFLKIGNLADIKIDNLKYNTVKAHYLQGTNNLKRIIHGS